MLLPAFIKDKKKYERNSKLPGLFLTLFAVCFAMLFFRAENLDTGYRMAITMIGINGFSLPEGIFVHLGSMSNFLLNLGVTIDSTAGSQITYGSLFCFGLLYIALFFPNSLDILRNYKPAIDYSKTKKGIFDLVFHNKITNLLILKTNAAWGIIIGILFAVGVMGLQRVSEFLYWQF